MTSNEQDKTFIFFDTNMLEKRFEKDCLNVSQPEFSDEYYFTKNFIIDNHLESCIKICIPEIVLMEIKKHLVHCYKAQSDSLNSNIKKFKRIFGDMCEIFVNKQICQSVEEYIDYINNYFDGVLDKNSNILSIIPYPRDNETFEKFVHKAMHSEKPFTKAKCNGKEYTDAGLKDAIIYETIYKFLDNNFCIFVTNDNDFKELFSKTDESINLNLCDNKDDLKKILINKYNIIDENFEIAQIIAHDEYFIKTLLNSIEFKEDSNYKFKNILSIEKTELGLSIKFSAIINGTEYKFDIIYEINANELVEVVNFTGENDE